MLLAIQPRALSSPGLVALFWRAPAPEDGERKRQRVKGKGGCRERQPDVGEEVEKERRMYMQRQRVSRIQRQGTGDPAPRVPGRAAGLPARALVSESLPSLSIVFKSVLVKTVLVKLY